MFVLFSPSTVDFYEITIELGIFFFNVNLKIHIEFVLVSV